LAGADGAKIQPIVELGQNIFKKSVFQRFKNQKSKTTPVPHGTAEQIKHI
jgi:hypothetical protein